jgi:hypothetical protein
MFFMNRSLLKVPASYVFNVWRERCQEKNGVRNTIERPSLIEVEQMQRQLRAGDNLVVIGGEILYGGEGLQDKEFKR